MEKFVLDKDINVFCVTAKSFPDGIREAFKQLHYFINFSEPRRFFGISRPNEKGEIVYKAAMEEKNKGEAEKFECEPFVIKSGNYISIVVTDYMNDIQGIGKAFHELISQPDIDPNGYCIEWYLNEKDVRCMVKAIDNI